MFAFFGTAKHLSVGPISLGCIYIPIALKTLGFDITDASEGGRAARAEAAVALTFYVFAIFLFMSILRLGSVIRFVSHSVMAGFVTATGIFVSINELKYVPGWRRTPLAVLVITSTHYIYALVSTHTQAHRQPQDPQDL